MPFWTRAPKRFADLSSSLATGFEEAKKRASILVIDDDPNAFPVELMMAEGYKIQYWNEVKNLRDLENGLFDIIVLDIHGICPVGLSSNDGLGILEHLKKRNPSQIVIAYSGKKFDLRTEKFWRIADDYLGKPTDLLVAKEKIDALLRDKFTADYYWNSLREFLLAQGVSPKDVENLESWIAQAILSRRPIAQHDLGKVLTVGKDVLTTTWVIIQLIQKFAG